MHMSPPPPSDSMGETWGDSKNAWTRGGIKPKKIERNTKNQICFGLGGETLGGLITAVDATITYSRAVYHAQDFAKFEGKLVRSLFYTSRGIVPCMVMVSMISIEWIGAHPEPRFHTCLHMCRTRTMLSSPYSGAGGEGREVGGGAGGGS